MPRVSSKVQPAPKSDNLHHYIAVKQGSRSFYLTTMTAGKLAKVSYASVRNRDSEEGSVQRILNPRRIRDLVAFAIGKADYPSSVVLNWVSREHGLAVRDGKLHIPDFVRSAQIIDGQHRIAGLREAIAEVAEVANIEIPVSIYDGLDTRGCADIFLSINTEQKPVPRSLVIDLYGFLEDAAIDTGLMRAKDIADLLDDPESLYDSPYAGLIKKPGAARMKGGIALSTAVTAIKPLVDEKGAFWRHGLFELEMQWKALLNFFKALREKYGTSWDDPKSNAFLYAAGFTGALEFFQVKLLPYCAERGDLQQSFMSEAIALGKKSLLRPSDTANLGGKAAANHVFESLTQHFNVPANPSQKYKI